MIADKELQELMLNTKPQLYRYRQIEGDGTVTVIYIHGWLRHMQKELKLEAGQAPIDLALIETVN